MILLYSIFFGAGVAAFIYTKIGRRLGYDNQQNVWTVVGVTFFIGTIVFYTLLKFVLNFS
jgi:hypothetical protein